MDSGSIWQKANRGRSVSLNWNSSLSVKSIVTSYLLLSEPRWLVQSYALRVQELAKHIFIAFITEKTEENLLPL